MSYYLKVSLPITRRIFYKIFCLFVCFVLGLKQAFDITKRKVS